MAVAYRIEAEAPVAAPAARDRGLDAFKGLLVGGMVLAHVLQLLGPQPLPAGMAALSTFVNLVSFSGFLFAFGAGTASGPSSGAGRGKPLAQKLVGPATLLFAYLLSGVAFRALVDPGRLDAAGLVAVLSFADAPGYSEFLLSFFLLALVAAFARPWVLWVARRPKAVIAAAVVGLLSTRLPTEGLGPLPGSLVGSDRFYAFPVLSYGLWFVLGAAWAVHGRRVTQEALVVAALASAWFVAEAMTEGLPARFSPSMLWVAGPALALVGYLALARRLARAAWVGAASARVGRGVLLQLLVTNLAIFSLQAGAGRFVGGWGVAIATAAGLMLAAEAVREIARR